MQSFFLIDWFQLFVVAGIGLFSLYFSPMSCVWACIYEHIFVHWLHLLAWLNQHSYLCYPSTRTSFEDFLRDLRESVRTVSYFHQRGYQSNSVILLPLGMFMLAFRRWWWRIFSYGFICLIFYFRFFWNHPGVRKSWSNKWRASPNIWCCWEDTG